ncbi:PH domain-containing protein [Synergistaceae bacterium OttesenSCG-928-I11]|nr:PH domain-containing protein [Synergistaceae bacterium OttesenSCG-928-I11]
MRSVCSMGAKDKMRYIENEMADGGRAIPFSLTAVLGVNEEIQYETRRHWATAIPWLVAALLLSRATNAVSLFLALLPFFQVKTYEYAVTNERILARETLFRKNETSIPLDEVADISVRKTPLSACLGIGTVVVSTARGVVVFRAIEDPDAFAFYAHKTRVAQ